MQAPKTSTTSEALAEAMRAMDAKEKQRGGKAVRRGGTSGSAYQLGTAAEHAAPVAAPVRTGPSPWKTQLGPREWKIAGAIAAALILALIGWKVFVPSAEEDDQGIVIAQIKSEGDKLVTDGKWTEAYEKYKKVGLLAAGREFKSGELKRTVEAARTAKDKIHNDNPELFDKARAANSKTAASGG